jgi:hypothetical protein
VRCEEGGRLTAAPAWISRVPAGASVEVPLVLRGAARGVARLAEITVSSAWPCELFRRTLRFPLPDEVLVRPQRVQFDPRPQAGPRTRARPAAPSSGRRSAQAHPFPRRRLAARDPLAHLRTPRRAHRARGRGSAPPWIAPAPAQTIPSTWSAASSGPPRRVALAGTHAEVRVTGERPRLVARRSELRPSSTRWCASSGGTVPGAAPRARAFCSDQDARPRGDARQTAFPFGPSPRPEPAPSASSARLRLSGPCRDLRRRSPRRPRPGAPAPACGRSGSSRPRRDSAPHAAHRRRPRSAPAIRRRAPGARGLRPSSWARARKGSASGPWAGSASSSPPWASRSSPAGT